MKKIVLILALTTNLLSLKAQVNSNTPIIPLNSINNQSYTIPNSGSYFKDTTNAFTPWVGTWEYVNGNTEFRIIIQKVTAVHLPMGTDNIPINSYRDLLNGGYYYKENGIVKTNQLIYANQLLPPLRCSVITNKVRIFYRDIDKPQLCCANVTLKLLPGSTNQATWEFDGEYKRNFSVPDNIILTKLP